MSIRLILVALLSLNLVSCHHWKPATMLNLNVFDQLQGKWDADFRANRMAILSQWIKDKSPDLVIFQEAQGALPGSEGGGQDSADAAALKALYPYRYYVHEMTGADGASYGYWLGSKQEPRQIWHDGFFFEGGVDRKTLAAMWGEGEDCAGVLSLHLSYQNSAVRQKEAEWILSWIKEHEKFCKNWIVAGDFNADEENEEIAILERNGLRSLVVEKKPTVGAFNPIRQIYGKDIPSRTIDWTFAAGKISGQGSVVFDAPVNGTWLSDHAGIWVEFRD